MTLVLCPDTAWARITTPGPGIIKTSLSGLGEAASIAHIDTGTEQNLLKLSVNVIILTVIGVTDTERQRSAKESIARLALPRL